MENMNNNKLAYENFERETGVEPEVFLSLINILDLIELSEYIGVSFEDYDGGKKSLIEDYDIGVLLRGIWAKLNKDISKLDEFLLSKKKIDGGFEYSRFYKYLDWLSRQQTINNNKISIRPLRATDISTVHKMMQDDRFSYLVPSKVGEQLIDTVIYMMLVSAKNMHDYRFIVKDNEIYGLLYAYDYSSRDKHAFLSIFMAEQSSVVLFRALAGYLDYYFNNTGIHKIYFDVYDSNAYVLEMLNRVSQVEQEGYFKDFRFLGGEYVGVYRFSISRDSYDALKSEYNKYFSDITYIDSKTPFK